MLQKAASQFFLTPYIGALGMLIQVGGNVVIKCTFSIWQYTQQLQETRMDLFNWYFVYSSDMVDGETPLVEVKTSCFDILQSKNVYTLTKCKQKLLADSSLLLFPAIADNAAQSQTLDTQKTLFVLYELVLLLSGKQLTTQDDFLIIVD